MLGEVLLDNRMSFNDEKREKHPLFLILIFSTLSSNYDALHNTFSTSYEFAPFEFKKNSKKTVIFVRMNAACKVFLKITFKFIAPK